MLRAIAQNIPSVARLIAVASEAGQIDAARARERCVGVWFLHQQLVHRWKRSSTGQGVASLQLARALHD
ncbi:hypothetical protein PC116_g16497 [Phytophthora cactorum]|uniref:Uncharacterized protein n=1 Tax=Phytophthora cactorum TaxID=29920 RepID=A0A8T1D272_9STRA|nr:hypothetical protein Pcac1_g25172 [Phytophthora cactorum]KAG2816519.1 hypothetical protein PC112_g13422 [Phytophthora cactorum]KAG2915024.1 hypothetical protein PC115_g11494 [Phytophthora cactorum]KAG2932063.1 hypothetical protein PC117_g13276 [Phytophthora cactorum]KAG3009299.1 hypothetical protein PC119_g13943 [Phytophthora cactorum]